MPLTKFQIKLTNDAVSPANYQQVGFAFNSSSDSPEFSAARIIRYFAQLSAASVLAAGTRIVSVDYRLGGSPGAVSVVWPTAELTAIATAFNTEGIPAVAYGTSYLGTSYGSGALCPLGSSCSVSELTEVAGRTGRGRHFTPFLSASAIDSAGFVGSSPRSNILLSWEYCMLGRRNNGAIPGVGIGTPVLAPGIDVTPIPIIAVKPQPVASNLESRRR